jgi:hypothetical protein
MNELRVVKTPKRSTFRGTTLTLKAAVVGSLKASSTPRKPNTAAMTALVSSTRSSKRMTRS